MTETHLPSLPTFPFFISYFIFFCSLDWPQTLNSPWLNHSHKSSSLGGKLLYLQRSSLTKETGSWSGISQSIGGTHIRYFFPVVRPEYDYINPMMSVAVDTNNKEKFLEYFYLTTHSTNLVQHFVQKGGDIVLLRVAWSTCCLDKLFIKVPGTNLRFFFWINRQKFLDFHNVL